MQVNLNLGKNMDGRMDGVWLLWAIGIYKTPQTTLIIFISAVCAAKNIEEGIEKC